MKIKRNSIIIGFVVALMILVSGISVYATATYYASQVTYKNGKTVEQALNELYASKDNRLYLYWKGNTFDDITGGWESSVSLDAWASIDDHSVTRKNAIFNTDHIDLSTNSTYQFAVANTKNKIDCTGYNYINIYYTMTKSYYTRVAFADRLDSGIYGVEVSGNVGESVDWFDIFMPQNGLRLITIPITEQNSDYIFINTIKGASFDTETDLKVYGVFLSTTIEP